MNHAMEQIVELHQLYNDLGEDLFFLEAVVSAKQAGYQLPEEYIMSSLKRLLDYIDQHTGEVRHLSQFLCEAAQQSKSIDKA